MKKASLGLVMGWGILVVVVLASMLRAAPQDPVNSQRNRAGSWEYGRLVVGDENYAWQGGESNVQPEVLNLDNLYRRIGGRSQATFTNLLNQIGKDGWELVTIDDTVYTFKRGR